MRLSELKKLVTEREKILLAFIVALIYFITVFGSIDSYAEDMPININSYGGNRLYAIAVHYLENGVDDIYVVIEADSEFSISYEENQDVGYASYGRYYPRYISDVSSQTYYFYEYDGGNWEYEGNSTISDGSISNANVTMINVPSDDIYVGMWNVSTGLALNQDGTPMVTYDDSTITHVNSLDGTGIQLWVSDIDTDYDSVVLTAVQYEDNNTSNSYSMESIYTIDLSSVDSFVQAYYSDTDLYNNEYGTNWLLEYYVDGSNVHDQTYSTEGFENYVNTESGLDTNIAGSASSNEFTVNFNESTFDITANYRSYGNLKIQFYDKENDELEDDISWLSTVFGDAIIDVELSKGETKTFGYPNDPEWGEDYWIVVYEESSLNSSVELPTWATWFEYGSTSQTDGTGSSTIMDVVDDEVESLEEAYAEATEAVTNATLGIAFIASIMTIFPYPFNVISIVIIAGVGVVLSVGLALTILGR